MPAVSQRPSAHNWLGWSAIILSTLCGLLLGQIAISATALQRTFAGWLHCGSPGELWPRKAAYGTLEAATSPNDMTLTCLYSTSKRVTFAAETATGGARITGLGIGCGLTYLVMALFALSLAVVRMVTRAQRRQRRLVAAIPVMEVEPAGD